MEYLKTKDIGEVVAEACTQVYINKPKHPIDFVGKWLLNYCRTQKGLEEQDTLTVGRIHRKSARPNSAEHCFRLSAAHFTATASRLILAECSALRRQGSPSAAARRSHARTPPPPQQ